jgi:FdhE protein
MSVSMWEEDQKILSALSVAEDTCAELRPLVSFYQAVFRAQFLARLSLAEDLQLPDPATCAERLKSGRILLTFADLQVGTERFCGLLRQMADVITHDNPGWELPREPLDSGALVGVARKWFESGEHMVGNGPPATLVALSVGFAVSSYLQEAAHRLLPQVHLHLWQRNICPVCGGKPGLGVLSRDDSSSLFCPRCHALWGYRFVACPYCEDNRDFAYYACTDEAYRLYVCGHCRRYLKAIDLRHTKQELIPAVERILSVALDLEAQQEGFIYC